MSRCGDLVLRLAAERNLTLDRDFAELLIKNFEKEVKRRRLMGVSDEQLAFDVAYRKTTEMRLAARQQKREAMIRLVKFKRNEARMKKYVEDSNGKYNEGDAIEAMIVGDSTLITGSRDSIDSRRSGYEDMFMGTILDDLGETLENSLRAGDLDREITLYQYDRNADVSDEAKQIHEILFKHANSRREKKNRAGAFIGEREDHLGRQTHDVAKISKTPREEWKQDILNLVDHEKTFSGFNSAAEIDEYLDELYMRFSQGKHYLVDYEDGVPPGSPKTINLAKKLSQSRTIHFKGGNEAFEYASKYSEASIWNRYIDGIRYDAKTIAMMEMFGPNPRAMLDSLILRAEQMAASRGVDIGRVKPAAIRAKFDLANGVTDIPGNVTLAEIGNGLRVLENVTKLGGAVISAFSDPVFKAQTLNRRTSKGFFGSYVNAFTNMINGVPRSDRKHVAKMTYIYTEATLNSIHTRAGAIDGMPGRISRLNELFFRWNLLQGYTINHKKGMATAMAFDLGRYKNVAFNDLPDSQRLNLELHNITPEEWAIIGRMETKSPEVGEDFITSQGVYTIADEDITRAVSILSGTTDVTDNMKMAYRDNLAIKLQSLFRDFADEGVVTPGAREKFILTAGGQQKGTYLGEFVRLVSQFKAFPLTVLTKQVLPTYRRAGGGVKGAAALVPMIAGATMLGYLTGAAKDVLKGKEPKDPRSLAALTDALLRGGGLGIFGDFMFAEYSRYGRSLQETFMGPAVGTFSDLVAQIHKTAVVLGKRGEVDVAGWFKFVKSITPGANLFYTEQAFNYLLFNGLIEMNQPGYMREMERRLRREYDQQYWLPPSSAF